VSGIFGDPTLLVRLEHRRRCLLFDVGEVTPIPTKLINETTDVFITHAHLDHIGDFSVLLRKRIGNTEPVNVYGPPEISDRIESLVDGFTWDRIEDRGPRFRVHEVGEGSMDIYEIVVGKGSRVAVGTQTLEDGIILESPRFVVRATTLDHGIPVIAYALDESGRFDVKPNVLRDRGIEPGDWLGELKSLAATRRFDERFELPDGSVQTVAELIDEMLIERPGQKVVYATDFGDTPQNRARIVELARDAHILVCEAAFTSEDADQAKRTGHLTARACAEIARAAGVDQLLPFHFSSRYDRDPEAIMQEIEAHCGGVRVTLEWDDPDDSESE